MRSTIARAVSACAAPAHRHEAGRSTLFNALGTLIQRRNMLSERTLKKRKLIETIKQTPLGVYEPYLEPEYQAWVSTLDGRQLGIVPLNNHVFGQELRPDIVHRVVSWQLECQRPG